jgi:hypothetical protein
MELRNRDGDMFANVVKVNNIYPMGLNVSLQGPGWLHGQQEGAHSRELAERLETVAMVATATGAEGTKATLLTWHQHLGHPSFKVVALSESGANGMVITDRPTKIPGLDACAACVAAKTSHSPHKEGRERAGEYLRRVHIDIAGPMPVRSASGKEYGYIVVDDYSRAVYTRPLRHKSEAPEAFKVFKAAAEGESC